LEEVNALKEAIKKIEEAKRLTPCGACRRKLDQIENAIIGVIDVLDLGRSFVEKVRENPDLYNLNNILQSIENIKNIVKALNNPKQTVKKKKKSILNIFIPELPPLP